MPNLDAAIKRQHDRTFAAGAVCGALAAGLMLLALALIG